MASVFPSVPGDASSVVYVWDNFYFGIFPAGRYDWQSRPGITLLVALGDEDFTLTNAVGQSSRQRAALVQRSAPVTFELRGSSYLAVNYFSLSLEYHSIKAFLAGRQQLAVEFAGADQGHDWLLDAVAERIDSSVFIRGCSQLLQSIRSYTPLRKNIDMRALYVAQKIRRELPELSPLEHYAEEVGVSPDRLSHLFSDALDVPVRSFVLLEKVRKACMHLLHGMPVSDASVQAGFADAAHFNRAVKRFYGITPGVISDFRKVHFF